MVFDEADHRDHEQISYVADEETGLAAIVAIHDTTLGPALGGTRIYDYDSEDAGLRDVLRLSEAMTYKAAAADLDLGGGKAVILGDPDEVKSDALLRSYGRSVEALGGRYVTSVDMNSTIEDMDVIAAETEHVSGTTDGLGNPSPVTARGVLRGIEACIEHTHGTDTLSDVHVAVQGIGKVGASLAADLAERGAAVTVADVDEAAVQSFSAEHGVDTVPPEEIYDVSCDVFAPCAMGGVINDGTIPRLECEIVAGSANNVLAERRHAAALQREGILYAPDFVVNAGGLITVYEEYVGGTRADAIDQAEVIGERLLSLLERAEDTETTVLDAAYEYAAERIDACDRTTPATSW